MIFKLLTEQHLEFQRLKGGCRGSSESTRRNATLLEITCHGSFISIINTTSERLIARNFFICRYFSFYEQLKFRAQLS